MANLAHAACGEAKGAEIPLTDIKSRQNPPQPKKKKTNHQKKKKKNKNRGNNNSRVELGLGNAWGLG